jgi:tetrahydrodipicolinate N-succinyltransferase
MPVTNDFGVFLPLTSIFDPESPSQIENLDPQIKNFIISSTHNYNNIANVLNIKETGYYVTTEILNSQVWFKNTLTTPDQSPFRNAYRLVVNFGALPNATTKIVAHNIANFNAGIASWTRIYATATNSTGAGIPIPYASSVLNENIIISVDDTNIYITTAIDYSAFTTTYVVLEYLKN